MVPCSFLFFFFNDTATTEIYTLSLHDALPILRQPAERPRVGALLGQVLPDRDPLHRLRRRGGLPLRSEEHTSELQSRLHLVCRLLLEKKKKTHIPRLSRPYVAEYFTRPFDQAT